MTATDELRRMLDERGVEWDYGIGGASTTEFMTSSGLALSFMDWRDRLTCTTLLTPEQAIEATLGRGECMAVSMRERDKRPYLHDELVCSKCGCQLAHEFGHVWQHFCPNCGRRIEVVGE